MASCSQVFQIKLTSQHAEALSKWAKLSSLTPTQCLSLAIEAALADRILKSLPENFLMPRAGEPEGVEIISTDDVHRTRANAETVQIALHMRDNGHSYSSIAERTGMSPTTVARILRQSQSERDRNPTSIKQHKRAKNTWNNFDFAKEEAHETD